MTHALAVVAHFDDAVIWAGGAIARTRSLGWDWTILTTCAAEPRRKAYVDAWCASFGARSIALDFIDHPDGGPFHRNDRAALANVLQASLRERPVDWVFTHCLDEEGEYGRHPNHMEAAQIVEELARRDVFDGERLVQFAYRPLYGSAHVGTVARPEASHLLQLDYSELKRKAEWCRRANDVERADPSLGDNTWLRRLGWPCPNPEAFLAIDLPPPFVAKRQ